MSGGDVVADAYAHCEAVTRREARNFYYGIRLLDHDRRGAMCAAYAFARRVDDIGDGTLESGQKLAQLDGETRALAELARGEPREQRDPVLVALADTNTRFPLPTGALDALIEGVRMDVAGVRYERFEDLVLYCRRVAGAIGRVCLAIFGLRSGSGQQGERADALADDLGVALQLTNILRDVREDAQIGRVYLPAEDLRRFGLPATADGDAAAQMRGALAAALNGSAEGAEELERFSALVHFEAERAQQWFARGLELAPLLDRRSAACVLAMAGIYRRLLVRIDAAPELALRERQSLPTREKLWVAAHVLLGGGR